VVLHDGCGHRSCNCGDVRVVSSRLGWWFVRVGCFVFVFPGTIKGNRHLVILLALYGIGYALFSVFVVSSGWACETVFLGSLEFVIPVLSDTFTE
jgi:hypothetical protein